MKKILSALLIISILLSVNSIGVFAEETDNTETQKEFLFSTEPYEDISGDGIYVYGYLGDADLDSEVTILDATQLQLHCARIYLLSGDALVIADADNDGEISITDATEIQLWIASLAANEMISHTVYTKEEENNDRKLDYDKFAAFLMEKGEYVEYDNTYQLYFDVGEPNSDIFSMTYFPDPEYRNVRFMLRHEAHVGVPGSITNVWIFEGNSNSMFSNIQKHELTSDWGVDIHYKLAVPGEYLHDENNGFTIFEDYIIYHEGPNDFSVMRDEVTELIQETIDMAIKFYEENV